MQEKVKGPAILLIVAGSLGILSALGSIGWTLVGSGLGTPEFAEGTPDWQKIAMSPALNLGTNAFGLLASCFFIFGGLKMKNLESWTLSMCACVLALIPCFGCCLVGIPAGVWGLIVLMNDEVKESFRS